MTARFFAITTRGLEDVCANELRTIPGIEILEIAYRRIPFLFTGEFDKLLGLRTVDDVFIDLGNWSGITKQRSALADIKARSRTLGIEEAARLVSQIRILPAYPIFSVTANFVGKRNYSYKEIKHAVCEGIVSRTKWIYSEADHESHLNI
jgi:23S rRNA G2445 N2-methylase RlmL